MLATPFPSNCLAEEFGGSQDFIARFSPKRCRVPWFGIAASGNDCMGTPVGNGVMAGAKTKGPKDRVLRHTSKAPLVGSFAQGLKAASGTVIQSCPRTS